METARNRERRTHFCTWAPSPDSPRLVLDICYLVGPMATAKSIPGSNSGIKIEKAALHTKSFRNTQVLSE
jgi:hypothetical protein